MVQSRTVHQIQAVGRKGGGGRVRRGRGRRIDLEWRHHQIGGHTAVLIGGPAIGHAVFHIAGGGSAERRRGRLQEHGVTVLLLDRARVGEAAHAAQGTEYLVERVVLLHQDDDVLDVLDGAGLEVRRNGQRLGDGRVEDGGGRAQAHELQKFTTVRQLAIICHKTSLARIEIQALNSTKWWRPAATRLHRQPRVGIVKSP